MTEITRILAEFYCDHPDMDAVREFAEVLVKRDCDCPSEAYELLNPGNSDTLHNLEIVAEYLGNPEYTSSNEFEVAVAKILKEKLNSVLLGNLEHSTAHRLIIFLSNNFVPKSPAHWIENLYNDFDKFGEFWNETQELDKNIQSRIHEIEEWLA